MHRILVVRPSAEAAEEVSLDELPALLKTPGVRVWVDLAGPAGDTERAIVRDVFKFHPLAIEDCFGARAHPKIDEYDGYLYLITHGLTASTTAENAEVVELDAFLGASYVVTYHSQASRSIAAVTELVLRTGYPLRSGPTAVLHAVLDRQTDGLEEVLDTIEERISVLEDGVFTARKNRHIASLLAVKRNIIDLRRWMAKQRDVLLRLGRREFALIAPEDALMFRDVHDHLVRLNDMLESFRDMVTSIQEAHLTAIANRTNEIMKFLTLFSSTILPLTVVTGIFGMNFEHMPELHWAFGYPLALGGMAVMTVGMLLYFRRRGWLGKDARVDEDPGRDDEPRA